MANEVTITVTGKDTGAKQKLNESAGAARGFRDSLQGVGEVAGGILTANLIESIGQKAIQFLGNAARAASDLEQALGGTEAVFGAASGAIDDFARTSAQSVGLSEAAFRDATTLIGGQLKRMTGDVDLAADASIQLVQVGADVAATYGGTTKEAVDAFAAALRGEADPAERFNLNLKQSVIQAKAVEMGLADTTAQVDEAAHAQALLAVVMEQSADAQGQFAREADTAAVSQQKASAAWEDAQAKLGQALLPAITDAANAMSILLGWLVDAPGPVRDLALAAGVLSAAMVLLGPRIIAVRNALVGFGVAANTANRALGIIGFVLTGLIGALAIYRSATADAAGETDGFKDSLDRSSQAATQETRELAAAALERRGALEIAREHKIALEDVTAAALGDAEAQQRVAESIAAAKAALLEQLEAGELSTGQHSQQQIQLEMLEQVLDQVASEYGSATAAADRESEAAESNAEATARATAELEKQNQQLRDLISNLFEAENQILGVRDAERQLEEAIDAATASVEDNGATLDINTEKGRENQKALDDIAKSAHDLTQAQIEAGESAETVTASMERAREKFIATAIQMGMTRREAEDLADQLGLIPDEVETTAELRDRMSRKIEQLERELEQLERDRVSNVYVNTWYTDYYTGANPYYRGRGGRAHGGIIGAQDGGVRSGEVLVNERGPELAWMPSGDVVSLPEGSTVIPAGQSAAMMQAAHNAAGGVTININVQGSIRSDREFIEIIRDEFLNGGFRGIPVGQSEVET